MTKKALIKISKVLIAIAFWGAVWAILSFRVDSELLLPSPISVMEALASLAAESEFWLVTLASLTRILIGILVSWVMGTLLGFVTSAVKPLDVIISPAISAVKATPVASFIILALLWIERDILPIFITALIVIPIIYANVTEGIRSVDRGLIEVSRIYRFTTRKKLTRLYIPSVLPYFTAACRSSLGMAWKAGIAAEILSTPDNSIGKELYYSKAYLETPSLFAWTLTVIVLSIIIEKVLMYGFDRFTEGFKEGGENSDKAA